MKVNSKRESRHYSVDICGIHQSLILTFGWLTKACWCGVRTQSLLARGPPWSNRRCRSHSSSRLQSSSGSLPSLTSATRLRIHSLQCLARSLSLLCHRCGLELRLGHARRGSLRGCRAHRLSQSLLQDRPQHHVEPSTPSTREQQPHTAPYATVLLLPQPLLSCPHVAGLLQPPQPPAWPPTRPLEPQALPAPRATVAPPIRALLPQQRPRPLPARPQQAARNT